VAPVTTILVTGAAGFIGRNLTQALSRLADVEILGVDVDTEDADLSRALARADLIYHLAGVNRPQDPAEFERGNAGYTETLCQRLTDLGRAPKIVISSSIQAAQDNPYGQSKQRAEATLAAFAERSGAEVVIYRLPNVFGKWCRPNYNSVVATFCHNIARGLPISISDETRELELVYIDDVVAAFASERASSRGAGCHLAAVAPTHTITLGDLAARIEGYRQSRETLLAPDFADGFSRCLYATYLSYLEDGDQSYPLLARSDPRGSLAEFVKSPPFGQVFVSHTKPGITRGNHYHDTKTEKFLVVAGEGIIRLRQVHSDEVISYRVRGEEYRVVDIPPGCTHSIENVGADTMVTLFWACEVFDPARADTHPCEVLRG
jgi:UDP-2-acetamido-2,6-beta-L-arabino-hexul-4-ose reductase